MFSALGVSARVQPDFTTQAVQQVIVKYAQFNGVKAFEKPMSSSAVVETYIL